MAVPKDFLWDAIEQLTTEVERLDPNSLVGARHRGFLVAREMSSMTGDRHPRSKSAEEDDQIAALYLAGGTLESVSIEANRSKEFVKKALTRRGVTQRQGGDRQKAGWKRQNVERVNRIREMRAEGHTLEEIGAAEKITRERVRQICAKNGIGTSYRPLRPEELLIVAEYVRGDSLCEVAERHHMTDGVLRDLILRSGNQIRPSRRTNKHMPETLEKAERVARLYKEGKTVSQIGETIGIAGPAAYRLLAIAGIRPNRNRSRAALQQKAA